MASALESPLLFSFQVFPALAQPQLCCSTLWLPGRLTMGTLPSLSVRLALRPHLDRQAA